MSQVLNSIGINPHKEEVRSALASQTLAFQLSIGKSSVSCLTLPGERFIFERLMNGLVRGSNVEVQFTCAETNKVRFDEALNHKPPNCKFALVNYNLLMTDYDVVGNHYGVGEALELRNPANDYYDMVWADYCGNMTEDNLKAIKKMAHKYGDRNFLFYATFSMSRFTQLHGASQYDYMEQTLTKILQNECKKHNAKVSCVFKAKYSGGENYHCHMFTIGFCIGTETVHVVDMDLRHTYTSDHGSPQYAAYRSGLKQLCSNSQKGVVDFALSASVTSVGKTKALKMISLANYDKKAMKDEIERVALSIRNQYDSVKDLNVAVHKIIREKYPKANLRHVSATITVRVTHRDLFAKTAKKRTVA